MPLRTAMFSPDEIEHALARVEVLKRTLSKSKGDPPFTSLFADNELPPFEGSGGDLRPVGKFDTVNARYKWNKLEPLSRQRQQPTLFVQQREDDNGHPSTSTSHQAPTPRLISGPKRPRPEERESDLPPELSEGSRKLRIRSISPANELPYSIPADAYDSDQDSNVSSRRSTPSTSRLSAPARDTGRLEKGADLPHPLAERVSDDLSQDWLSFTKQELDPEDGKMKWKCTWIVGGEQCYYRAKKQLMKRHIQGTHQEMKRFKCPYEGCPDRYGQKSALEVHVSSRHTGKPHKPCPYDGCSQAFKDPARLHRHKVEVHGYVPKATKRSARPSKPGRPMIN